MSGPLAEFATPKVAVDLIGWRWPMLLMVEMEPQPHAAITCGRGMCREVLLELTEIEADSWPIDPADLADMCKEHMPDCKCGTVRERTRRIG